MAGQLRRAAHMTLSGMRPRCMGSARERMQRTSRGASTDAMAACAGSPPAAAAAGSAAASSFSASATTWPRPDRVKKGHVLRHAGSSAALCSHLKHQTGAERP